MTKPDRYTSWFTPWFWRRLHCVSEMRRTVPDRELDAGYCLDRYSVEHGGIVTHSAP